MKGEWDFFLILILSYADCIIFAFSIKSECLIITYTRMLPSCAIIEFFESLAVPKLIKVRMKADARFYRFYLEIDVRYDGWHYAFRFGSSKIDGVRSRLILLARIGLHSCSKRASAGRSLGQGRSPRLHRSHLS